MPSSALASRPPYPFENGYPSRAPVLENVHP